MRPILAGTPAQRYPSVPDLDAATMRGNRGAEVLDIRRAATVDLNDGYLRISRIA
ncbi:hypothetical protein ACW0JT_04335 [Arthrobacter sp. SA17]